MNSSIRWVIGFSCMTILTLFGGSAVVANDNSPAKTSELKFVPAKDIRFSEVEIKSGLPESYELAGENPSDDATEYYWFQYGDQSSRSICLKFSDSQPEKLWVDFNRNKKFSPQEVSQSSKQGVWFVELTAEYGQAKRQTSKQLVRIRRGSDSQKWYLATAGYRAGKADFNGQSRDAKLEDKNSNGLWFDPEDRLFVDFDDNGKISRLTERIPAQGMRKIRGAVYAVAGVASGKKVSISEVKGSGFLIPKIELSDKSAKLTSVSALLGSNTGVGIPIKSINDRVEVPLGDWHVENVRLQVANEDKVFTFVFENLSDKKLVSVADKETHEIRLLGELKLSSGSSLQRENQGTYFTLTPRVTTASNCYLVSSQTGSKTPSTENRLHAWNSSPQAELEAGSSGFS